MRAKKILCPRCSQEIEFDEDLFHSNLELNLECNACHTKMILQESASELVKDAAKSTIKGLGKLCWKGLKTLANEVNPETIAKRQEDANMELNRLMVDYWDKDQCKRQLRARINVYEKQIIYDRLQQIEESESDA